MVRHLSVEVSGKPTGPWYRYALVHLPGIWQLGLHKELLGALCWVEVTLPGHPLNLLQLASLGSSLNVSTPAHALSTCHCLGHEKECQLAMASLL